MKRTRLQRLAHRHEQRALALRSTYVCVADESELPGRLAQLAAMGYAAVKCYIGVDLDDWGGDDGPEATAAASVAE